MEEGSESRDGFDLDVTVKMFPRVLEGFEARSTERRQD